MTRYLLTQETRFLSPPPSNRAKTRFLCNTCSTSSTSRDHSPLPLPFLSPLASLTSQLAPLTTPFSNINQPPTLSHPSSIFPPLPLNPRNPLKPSLPMFFLGYDTSNQPPRFPSPSYVYIYTSYPHPLPPPTCLPLPLPPPNLSSILISGIWVLTCFIHFIHFIHTPRFPSSPPPRGTLLNPCPAQRDNPSAIPPPHPSAVQSHQLFRAISFPTPGHSVV